MKKGIIRKGAGFSIDVLAVQKEMAAGTLTDSDRKTLDRIMPGLYNQLKKRAARAAREGKAKL